MNRNELNKLNDYIDSITRETISVDRVIRQINLYKQNGKTDEANTLIKLLEKCADKEYLEEVRWSYE